MTIQALIKQAEKSGLVILPREEYEAILSVRKIIPEVKPTKAELKAIERGERAIREGKFKPWSEVKNELANIHRKARAKAIGKNRRKGRAKD